MNKSTRQTFEREARLTLLTIRERERQIAHYNSLILTLDLNNIDDAVRVDEYLTAIEKDDPDFDRKEFTERV